MTSRIPDQLRQWHAQFIAGDVLFSRIMADIDAAIACYVDPLTAEKVIELAQLYMLKIALYEAAKQLNVRDLGLLARQGCVAQALELAELWCNEPVKYFERLVAIYTALPTENSPLLDKLFALLEQRNMPEEDVEKLVKVFLKRGKPEAAWQIARQTTEFRYQHR
jgi:hypothetical protein